MKNVVLGVTGGIAAYKALDVVSKLKKSDVNVDVIMTKSSQKFVTDLSFQSLSQNPVITDMFQEPKAFEIAHISLAKKADVLLVCPATANIIGKVSNGIADDMLSTTIMATRAKVVFALAMNTNMYENPIVQDNINKLKKLGYYFIEPESGRLACGDVGKGKLEDTTIIYEKVMELLKEDQTLDIDDAKKDLLGVKVLITAGPTIVPIDPVRILTNRSSGKMGYSLAEEAKRRGADVTLISGTRNLKDIEGIKTIHIETNQEMLDASKQEFKNTDILIMTAAVADYKIKEFSSSKIKKEDGELNLSFVRDNDILKTLSKEKEKQYLVGFAAESDNHDKNALGKLKKKNLDMIVMNDISESKVFGKADTKITVFTKDSSKDFEGTKANAASFIINEVVKNIK